MVGGRGGGSCPLTSREVVITKILPETTRMNHLLQNLIAPEMLIYFG